MYSERLYQSDRGSGSLPSDLSVNGEFFANESYLSLVYISHISVDKFH